MNNINLTAPTDYSTQLDQINRQRLMAQKLQEEGLSPIDTNVAPGVHVSWTQGLAKAIQAGLGGYMQNKLNERQTALGQQQRAASSADLAKAMELMTGKPAIAPTMADSMARQPNPDGSLQQVEATPGQAQVPPNRSAAYAALLQSQDPVLRQMGMTLQLKEAEPYNLGQGETRFGPGATVIAKGEPKRIPPMFEPNYPVGDGTMVQPHISLDGGMTWQPAPGSVPSPKFSKQVISVTAGGGVPPGLRLKPGERYNPQTDTVEPVPGSDLYRKQADKYAKDSNVLNAINTKFDNAIAKIDSILDEKNKDAFNSNFGGYNAYATSLLPGKTQDVGAKIESVKNDMKAAGLEMMRSGGSIGAMTEREWPIVQGMIDTITPKMSEDEARRVFNDIKGYLNTIKKNSADTFSGEWEGSVFHNKKSPPQAGSGLSPAEEAELAALKAKYGR